ncbi:MAG: hypothetical protein ACJ779_10850 [Chloroflexota bacterium]
MLAAWAFVGVAGALGVGIDVTSQLGPLVLVPVLFALFVVVGGRSLIVLAISTVGGLMFALLGAWNYFRAEEFEQTNPGSVDISGHDVSGFFVFLALATAVWSLGAIGLTLRARRLDRHRVNDA